MLNPKGDDSHIGGSRDSFNGLLQELQQTIEQLSIRHYQEVADASKNNSGLRHILNTAFSKTPVSERSQSREELWHDDEPQFVPREQSDGLIHSCDPCEVQSREISKETPTEPRTPITPKTSMTPNIVKFAPETSETIRFNRGEEFVDASQSCSSNQSECTDEVRTNASEMKVMSMASTASSSYSRTRTFVIRQTWLSDPERLPIAVDLGNWTSSESFKKCQQQEQLTGFMQRWVVRPQALQRSLWLIMAAAYIFYDVVVVPVELAFDFEKTSAMRIINMSGNIFWTLDMIFMFFTGVITRFGVLEMRVVVIAAMYVRTWFFFDLFLLALDWNIWALSEGRHSPLSVMRWVRIFRITRVYRFLSLSSFNHLIRRWAIKLHITTGVLDVLRISLSATACLLVSVHFGACAWHYIGGKEEGWISRWDLESAPLGRRYIFCLLWTINRVQGVATANTLHDASSWECGFEALFVFLSLVAVTIWISQVNTASMSWTLLNDHHQLKKFAHQYTWRHKLSEGLHDRIMKFLDASDLGGPQEIAVDEEMLVRKLPTQIQQDLLYEANGPLLCRKQLFVLMSSANPRAVRHICFEALSLSAAIEGEAVFAVGDVCHSALFLRCGCFSYSSEDMEDVTILEVKGGIQNFGKLKSRTLERFGSSEPTHRNTINEIVLWTPWTHVGSLYTTCDSMVVALSATEFGKVITNYTDVYSHACTYAKRFVWKLKHTDDSVTDLTTFDFTAEELEDHEFVGSELDHFLFISHYKVEAGTEATLIRDSLESIIKRDPRHPGHDLLSPIFVDSEDLIDLAQLVSHVELSRCLLLLLTPGLLSRPWCLLEIVTAVRSRVHIVLVEIQRPGLKFPYPDDNYYMEFLQREHLDRKDIELLESEGVQLQEVVRALRKVFKKIALPFSPHKSRTVRQAEINDILKRC